MDSEKCGFVNGFLIFRSDCLILFLIEQIVFNILSRLSVVSTFLGILEGFFLGIVWSVESHCVLWAVKVGPLAARKRAALLPTAGH